MKPYVSYRVPQIKEGPMTADRLYQEIKNNIDIIEHRETPWGKIETFPILYIWSFCRKDMYF